MVRIHAGGGMRGLPTTQEVDSRITERIAGKADTEALEALAETVDGLIEWVETPDWGADPEDV